MSIRCRLGWHKHRVSSHRLGQPWVFNMYCPRCFKHWTEEHWLPPQPITCEHDPDNYFHLRPPMSVATPDGIKLREWLACRICYSWSRIDARYGPPVGPIYFT